MKNLFALITMLFLTISLIAQDITGDWNGTLNIQGTSLKIVFHINDDGDNLTATMDSPDQGANGIPTDQTTFENGELIISAKKLGIKYKAQLDKEGKFINGNFNQNGMNLPLKMEKKKKEKLIKKSEGKLSKDAEKILGSWNGALDVNGTQLRIVFNVAEENGNLITTMDSPDQGATGLATDKTTFKNGKLTILVGKMGINYTAQLSKDGTKVEGEFKQGGMTLPLILSREKVEKKVLVRPQVPKEFPYQQEEVKFQNPKGGHHLAGTLTIPSNRKFDKVVILISGSGPQNRNEELLGHQPFLVLSDRLTKSGIAVLRYDDRGVAESEGDFSSATSRDFADDAAAAVAFLKSRKDMAGKQIGLMGHSEGGMIAPIVSSENKAVDFIVLLAGPGIDIIELMMLQTDKIAESEDTPKEVRAANAKTLSRVFNFMKKSTSLDKNQLESELLKILNEEYATFSDEIKKEIGDKDEFFAGELKMMMTDWFLYFMRFNPQDYLSKVTCPVLAINGELDLQVTAKENLEGIRQSLKKSNNTNVTIKEFKGLNHLFQKTTTGAPSEYATLEETFNEEVMIFVSDWIKKLK